MTFLSKNIRFLRNSKNMSQDELASKLNKKSFTTIQKWESGTAEPSVSAVAQMSTMFGVGMTEMVFTDLQNPEPIKEEAVTELRPDEGALLETYNLLNRDGREEVLRRIREMTEISRYTKDTELSKERA